MMEREDENGEKSQKSDPSLSSTILYVRVNDASRLTSSIDDET